MCKDACVPVNQVTVGTTPSAAVVQNLLAVVFPAGAAFYANEAVVGAGLADFIAAGKRSELFITSKVWNTHHKPADARYDPADAPTCTRCI